MWCYGMRCVPNGSGHEDFERLAYRRLDLPLADQVGRLTRHVLHDEVLGVLASEIRSTEHDVKSMGSDARAPFLWAPHLGLAI